MKKIEFLPSWFLSVGIAFLVVLAVYILIPNFTTSPDSRIAPDEIRVLDSGPFSQVRRPSVNDPEIYLKRQFSTRQKVPRQFSYVFNPDNDAKDLAIFAPIIGGEASISINGAPFARSELQSFHAFGFGASNIFTPIDARYFHPGSNRIDILLAEDPYRTGLRSLYIGDTDQVEKTYDRFISWLVTLKSTAVLAGVIGFICAMMGLLLGGHRMTMFGGLVLSAIILTHSFSPENLSNVIPPTASAALVFIAVLLSLAGLRHARLRYTVLVKAFIFVALLGAAACLYSVLSPSYISTPITFSSFTLLSLYPVLIAALPLILFSDLMSLRTQMLLAQEEARQKDEVITDQRETLRREIEQKAVMQERQRFTRDMHDGIGGQLLSLLVRVRSGQVDIDGVETEIQSGINDLRLVVDSLDHVGDDLSAALVTFQSRAQAQFSAVGISMKWSQDSTINSDKFGTRRVLNLYRFLQEAVSNILRHAEAENVDIGISYSEESKLLKFAVEDDGKGLQNRDTSKAGKGLKNMQSRAQKLDGALSFSIPESGKGTRIELIIPLESQT